MKNRRGGLKTVDDKDNTNRLDREYDNKTYWARLHAMLENDGKPVQTLGYSCMRCMQWHFPESFGTSINGHVTACEYKSTVKNKCIAIKSF